MHPNTGKTIRGTTATYLNIGRTIQGTTISHSQATIGYIADAKDA
jgi:hypothetical protein